MKKLLAYIVPWLLTTAMMAPSAPLNLKKDGVFTVVIDAGHGGKDPGCLGHKGSREKEVVLAIAQKLSHYLTDSIKKDLRILFTRDNDNFIELWQRAAMANKSNADLFVSLHCNANNHASPQGSESYVMGLHKSEGNLKVSKRENSSILLEDDYNQNEHYQGFDPNSPESHIIFSLYQSAHREQSLKIADLIQQKMESRQQINNRGVKQAGFVVLWKTTMPSVLVETGFLTNPKDEEILISEEGQDNIAIAVASAIRQYKDQLDWSY